MDPVPMAIGMAAAGAGRGRVHAPVAQCVRCGRACFGAKAMATGPGGARIPMPRDTHTHWRARVVVAARQGRARPAFTCVSTLQVQEAGRSPTGAGKP